jgi:hypothetical protein
MIFYQTFNRLFVTNKVQKYKNLANTKTKFNYWANKSLVERNFILRIQLKKIMQKKTFYLYCNRFLNIEYLFKNFKVKKRHRNKS